MGGTSAQVNIANFSPLLNFIYFYLFFYLQIELRTRENFIHIFKWKKSSFKRFSNYKMGLTIEIEINIELNRQKKITNQVMLNLFIIWSYKKLDVPKGS